jgi:hypothetical protein
VADDEPAVAPKFQLYEANAPVLALTVVVVKLVKFVGVLKQTPGAKKSTFALPNAVTVIMAVFVHPSEDVTVSVGIYVPDKR